MDFLISGFHYIWSFALIISIIVFVHEGGHFLVARLCGVQVEVFSIGFGRELIGRTDRHGTRWKISLWPLGGYVKMLGDAGAASTADKDALQMMSDEQKARSFHHKPLWAKAAVVVAGPAANFLLTIAVFTWFLFTIGLASSEPVVGEIMKDTPAAHAGLKTGDRILTVDGKRMKVFNDIPEALVTNLGQPIALEVKRGEKQFTLTLTPTTFEDKDPLGNVTKRPLIGIRSEKLKIEDMGFGQALATATQKTYDMCRTSLHLMGQMITGKRDTADLKGPLGIAKMSGEVTSSGDTMGETLRMILWFVAMLSANLGLINLLPIPMLDGGHLAFYGIEALRGRPMAEKFQEYSYRVGLAMVVGLMALSLFNDVRNIVM